MEYNVLNKTNGCYSNKLMDSWLTNLGYTLDTVKLLKNPPKMHDYCLLNDLEEAVNMINDCDPQKICIVGDYDCDGVTATAVMVETIKFIKDDEPLYIIPHRINDGYGISQKHIKKSIENGVELIITVDNGIMCHEAVQYARDNGIKIIITDHHTPGKTLPNADAIVHPMLGSYPFGKISGCQVAYKIATGLLDINGIYDSDLMSYLKQLSTISIVSDVMPIASNDKKIMEVNENRKWLMDGLKLLDDNKKCDWRLKILKNRLNLNHVDENVIGFYIAPAINAVGRLDDATAVVDFLTTENEDIANQLSSWIFYMNEERKKIKTAVIENTVIDTTQPGIIISGETIHEGISGILSGNYAGTYRKPTITFTKTTVEVNGKMENAFKGSARSGGFIDLFGLLSEIQNEAGCIYAFGGHKEAAGLTVLEKRFSEFLEEFQRRVAEKRTNISFKNDVLEVNSYKEREELLNSIKDLKPFGNGLPLPKGIETLSCKTLMLTAKGYLNFKCWQKDNDNFILNEFWSFNDNEDLLNSEEIKSLNKSVSKTGTVTYKQTDKKPGIKFGFYFEYSYTVFKQGEYEGNASVLDVEIQRPQKDMQEKPKLQQLKLF